MPLQSDVPCKKLSVQFDSVESDSPDMIKLKKAIESKFRITNKVLRMTGMFFEDSAKCSANRPMYWFKVVRAFVLFGLAVHQTSWLLYHILSSKKYDETTARSLVIFNWMLQATISEAIFIYWQMKGYITRLYQNVHCPKGCCRTVIVINQTLFATFSLFGVFILMTATTVILAWMGKGEFVMFDPGLLEAYGPKSLSIISILIHMHALFVWISILTFYILIGRAVQHELLVFNDSLRNIGTIIPGDSEKLCEELSERYATHVQLANRIRVADSTFEVYTFAMVGTNIPTTIFTLLTFFLALQSSCWTKILISSPDVLFCICELIGLTAAPAKVHAAIREVESIVYGNLRIWTPFNEKVYQLASVFISHANQSNLGITLWGFAVVTKPLILTTMSLTVTYLTFLLQVQYKDDPCTPNSNSTSHFVIS
ncbi:CBR-GUR-5 protein [Ditylenchus destructor]|uniref:CBR-GUR-5 protein n=1 Tax=Ditylenchus destructor TaxID=166010 RepID=A0AAD4N9V7_9BILA|nr:CBR-GUR-5 protein [Ditylenchus destructor]